MLYAFDLLFLDGEALWKKPLEDCRLALGGIIPKRSPILILGRGRGPCSTPERSNSRATVSKRLDRACRSKAVAAIAANITSATSEIGSRFAFPNREASSQYSTVRSLALKCHVGSCMSPRPCVCGSQ